MKAKFFLILLLIISINSKGQDTQINKTKSHGFVFAQFGTVLSIYSIGYGYEFYSKTSKYSLQLSTGFGLDFMRFAPYYNFENMLKTRHSFNFNQSSSIFLDAGIQFIYNPWYISDSAKYFPNCTTQRCPEFILNYFAGLGYQRVFNKKYSLSVSLAANYYNRRIFYIPGIQFRYLLNKK